MKIPGVAWLALAGAAVWYFLTKGSNPAPSTNGSRSTISAQQPGLFTNYGQAAESVAPLFTNNQDNTVPLINTGVSAANGLFGLFSKVFSGGSGTSAATVSQYSSPAGPQIPAGNLSVDQGVSGTDYLGPDFNPSGDLGSGLQYINPDAYFS